MHTVVCVGHLRNLTGAVLQVLARIGEMQETLKTQTSLKRTVHFTSGNENPTSLPEGICLPMETLEKRLWKSLMLRFDLLLLMHSRLLW